MFYFMFIVGTYVVYIYNVKMYYHINKLQIYWDSTRKAYIDNAYEISYILNLYISVHIYIHITWC